MSELLTKKIKTVTLKSHPWGQQGYYGHRVVFEDGSKGEIYQCSEAHPDWLVAGKTLSFILKPSNFPDTPFVQTMESVEEEKQHTPASPPVSQPNSYNRFQKKSNSNGGGGGWKGGYSRYEDSPDIWLRKQKFISILKLYEVLMPLVVKGDIKYGDIQTEVSKHLKYTIQEAGMNDYRAPQAPQASHSQVSRPVSTPVTQTTAKSPAIASNTSKQKPVDDREIHSNREREPEPEVSPELYSNPQEPTLFAQDTAMDNDPVPNDLLDKIKKCDTKSKLLGLQKSLTPEQVNNKNIMDAFFAKKKELTKRK